METKIWRASNRPRRRGELRKHPVYPIHCLKLMSTIGMPLEVDTNTYRVETRSGFFSDSLDIAITHTDTYHAVPKGPRRARKNDNVMVHRDKSRGTKRTKKSRKTTASDLADRPVVVATNDVLTQPKKQVVSFPLSLTTNNKGCSS